MAKFKVGDKVRVLVDEPLSANVLAGFETTIICDHGDDCYAIDAQDGEPGGWHVNAEHIASA